MQSAAVLRWGVVLLLAAGACSSGSNTNSAGNGGGGEGGEGPGGGGTGGAIEEPAGGRTSSLGLIASARTAGAIDEKTAAYYELLALFAPSALPEAFSADVPPWSEATGASSIALANLDQYGPTERAVIEAMLAPPSDPRFLAFPKDFVQSMGFRSGKPPSCTEEFLEARMEDSQSSGWRGNPIETRYFSVIPVAPREGKTSTAMKALGAFHARLEKAMGTPTPATGPIPAQPSYGAFLDAVYELLEKEVFHVFPVAHGGFSSLVQGKDRASKIPIYVPTCDWSNGFVVEYGHVVASVIGFEDPALRRIYLPHEIIHLFQFVKLGKSWPKSADDGWPIEATAVFGEDFIGPDVKRWAGNIPKDATVGRDWFGSRMDRSFRCPEEPFHTVYFDECQATPRPQKHDSGGYSKFAFFKYLERKKGLTPSKLMEEVWSRLVATKGDPVSAFEWEHIAEFQFSLLGDPAQGAAYYRPDDRKAFFDAGKARNLHYPPTDGERWTIRAEESKYPSLNHRVGLHQDASTGKRTKLEGSILPGATHRWLIELPSGMDVLFDDFLKLVIDSTPAGGEVLFWIAPLDGTPARPGEKIDLGNGFTKKGVKGFPTQLAWTEEFGDEPPRLLAATATNTGKTAVDYQVGLTLGSHCFNSCEGHYESFIVANQCAREICEFEEYHPEDMPECISDMQAALDSWPYLFCAWACDAFATFPLDKPYEDWIEDAELSVFTSAIYRESTVPRTTWAGLTPLSPWPGLSCLELTLED